MQNGVQKVFDEKLKDIKIWHKVKQDSYIKPKDRKKYPKNHVFIEADKINDSNIL